MSAPNPTTLATGRERPPTSISRVRPWWRASERSARSSIGACRAAGNQARWASRSTGVPSAASVSPRSSFRRSPAAAGRRRPRSGATTVWVSSGPTGPKPPWPRSRGRVRSVPPHGTPNAITPSRWSASSRLVLEQRPEHQAAGRVHDRRRPAAAVVLEAQDRRAQARAHERVVDRLAPVPAHGLEERVRLHRVVADRAQDVVERLRLLGQVEDQEARRAPDRVRRHHAAVREVVRPHQVRQHPVRVEEQGGNVEEHEVPGRDLLELRSRKAGNEDDGAGDHRYLQCEPATTSMFS